MGVRIENSDLGDFGLGAPAPRPAARGEIIDAVCEALGGRSDLELANLVLGVSSRAIVLVGPHGSEGVCWCQPRMVTCEPSGGAHSHPEHRDVRH